MKLWFRKASALAVLCLLVVSAAGCGFITKLKARDRLNKGVREYTAKEFNKAENYFKESIELDPALLNARLYLATTYSAMYSPGLSSEKNLQTARNAIKTFEDVLQQAGPQDTAIKVTAMTSIAGLYDKLEQYDKAKEWCRKLLDLDPENTEALYRIAVIDYNISSKRTGNSGEGVSRLSTQEKDATVKLIEEGITTLQSALNKRPDYGEAMEYLNLLYREQAKFTKDADERTALVRKAQQLAAKAFELKRLEKEKTLKEGKKKTGV